MQTHNTNKIVMGNFSISMNTSVYATIDSFLTCFLSVIKKVHTNIEYSNQQNEGNDHFGIFHFPMRRLMENQEQMIR